MKILFLIDHFQGAGGTEKHLSQLARMLLKSGYKPMVIVFDLYDNHLARDMQEEGIDVVHFPVGRYYTPEAMVKLVKLAQFIRKQDVQIVQTFHFKSDTFGVIAARLAGVRHVISSRRDMGDIKARQHVIFNRCVNPWIDGFIVVADAVGRALQEREKVPQAKIRTIYNGVDTVKYCPPTDGEKRKARETIGLRPDDYVVGTVAWFRQEKNHQLLLEAMDLLSGSISEMRMLWVGTEGPVARTLHNEVRLRGLEEKVIFAGEKEDVRECLRCCDVGALVPSANEGFSNAVLEKMAMGLPLVVTDIGGNAEAVVHGYNGFVIPPGDKKQLAATIGDLYGNQSLRRIMGTRSRERAEAHFSPQAMVRQHEEVYESLVQARRFRAEKNE